MNPYDHSGISGKSPTDGASRLDKFVNVHSSRLGGISLLLAVVSLVAAFNRSIATVVFLLLFVLIMAYAKAPHIRRQVRVWSFRWLRVSTVATIGALVVILPAARFIYNMVVAHVLEITEVLYSVLFLNVSVALVFLLLLSGRVRVLDPKDLLIKIRKSDAIYWWNSELGLLRLIPDAPTMFLLGLRTVDVRTVSSEEFDTYQQATPLQSVSESMIAEISDDHWLIWENQRLLIPDTATLQLIRSVGALGPKHIDHVGNLRRGADLPSVAGFR